MKKFFKKTVKFLFDLALMVIMLVSAQHAMNLPLGWASIGYILIFCAALTVWTNKQGEECHKEDIITYREIFRFSRGIFVYAANGKDEFTITAPNEVIFNPYIKFLTQNIIYYNDNKYKVSSMIKDETETEVTWTKIN